jgi:hypothetical protein
MEGLIVWLFYSTVGLAGGGMFKIFAWVAAEIMSLFTVPDSRVTKSLDAQTLYRNGNYFYSQSESARGADELAIHELRKSFKSFPTKSASIRLAECYLRREMVREAEAVLAEGRKVSSIQPWEEFGSIEEANAKLIKVWDTIGLQKIGR